jgi:protein-ribulosamine 3-kinase
MISYSSQFHREISTMPPLDPNIAQALGIKDLDNVSASISTLGGGCSTASASKLIVSRTENNTTSHETYFLKTATGEAAEVMLRGEHASLSAIHTTVSNLCPKSYGWGRLANDSNKCFLIVQYLDLGGRSSSGRTKEGESLAARLAKLHTTPAPVPKGYEQPMFGFPVETCCGDTAQDNSYSSSWADFYAERRLRFIKNESRRKNGANKELENLVERIIQQVVPRLIGDKHLNGGSGVVPVVVHGDLWSGNKSSTSSQLGDEGGGGEVIYDPSACYAHSEYELGIMKMFGGFGGQFLKEYHTLCPKTEPTEEYEDRVALYEL